MTTNNIETERLILRSTRESDADFCLSMWLDDEMGKYMSDPPRDKADAATLNFAQGIESDESWYPFVAILKETGEAIGTCSIIPMENPTHWDLGYAIHKNYWRQGYATEMLTAVIDFAYAKGARKFTAKVAQENAGSNGVMRKLGFVVEKEGSFKKLCTDIVYADYTYVLMRE